MILYPLFMALVNSLKDLAESAYLRVTLPGNFHFENYATVWAKANVPTALLNGLMVAGGSAALCVLLGSMASFVISRRKCRYSSFLYYLFVMGLIFNIAIIPTMRAMQLLRLINTTPGLIIVETATSLAFCVFVYCGFFGGIPHEIDEAAVIDGCRPLAMFFRVVFPLLKPVNATIAIIVFLAVWNDFQLPLYLISSTSKYTLPMTIYIFCGKYASSWNLVFADIILCISPVLIAFFLAQKYIVEGMTTGAVKG